MVVRKAITRAVSVTAAFVFAGGLLLPGTAQAEVAQAKVAQVSVTQASATDVRVGAAHSGTAERPQLEAPKDSDTPNGVRITGKFPGGKLTVRADDDRETFNRLIDQVDWLTSSTPMATPPRVNKLGPKFTLTLLIKDAPQRTYDVYPLAAGGPRIYRPAKQPDFSKSKAGWFYGELTMTDALRAAGAPLPEPPDAISGGIGGGERIVRTPAIDPARHVTELVTDMRRLVLINGAVALTIALGLAGIAFLIRRKV